MHRLVVAALHRLDLRMEACRLVFGIVEFGKPVGEFAAVDEQLEAVGDARLAVGLARQGRDFHRVMGDEGRLDEFGLDRLLEDFQQQLAPAVTWLDMDMQSLAMPRERIAIAAVGCADVRIVMAHRLVQSPAPERRRQIDVGAVPMQLRGAEHFDRDVPNHVLGQIHDLDVGRIGFVEFEHGELGIVPRRHALVAETAVDLVHALETADHQSLQIQLRRHAQIQIQIQCVVVGNEGLGHGAARDVMHHRRLDFEEAPCVQPAPHRAEDARSRHEDLARFRGHDQVDIPLAVALFDIRQSMPLVRQWPQRLGQQPQRVALQRQLTGPGAHQGALRGDDVADIPSLELFVGVAEGIGLQEQLQPSAHVLDLREAGLAHDPLGHQPAGDLHAPLAGSQRLARPAFGIGEFGLQIAGVIGAAHIVRECDALFAQSRKLGATLGDELVVVGLILVLRNLGLCAHHLALVACVMRTIIQRAQSARYRVALWERLPAASSCSCEKFAPASRSQ